jgi:hypothetical protein
MDFTTLVTAVDFDSAVTAIASVGVAVIGVLVALRGYRFVTGAVSR